MSRRSYRLFPTSGQGESWGEVTTYRGYRARHHQERGQRIGRTGPRASDGPPRNWLDRRTPPRGFDARAFPRVRASWAGSKGKLAEARRLGPVLLVLVGGGEPDVISRSM